jgi:N5-(cytidine 5'-diphosphoramidyl)-L-glutamine hydrolase
MCKNIIVGVSQRVDSIASYDEIRDVLDHRLIQWLVEAGCTPIPIPNTLVSCDNSQSVEHNQVLLNWLETLNIKALVLSGGNNIGEFSMRDRTENTLLSWAEKNSYPVLGICRGMQMMGIRAGAELIKVTGHVRAKHKLQVSEQLTKYHEMVNSYHDFALKECPKYFKVTARSEDGCLEAIKHNSLPWEAWMWHPEREDEFSSTDILRFKKLLNNEK